MTGLETLLAIAKVSSGLLLFIGGAIIKYLYNINQAASNTTREVHSLKEEVKSELTALKYKVDSLDNRMKDSYSRSETDALFARFKSDSTEKIYEIVNKFFQRTSKKDVQD